MNFITEQHGTGWIILNNHGRIVNTITGHDAEARARQRIRTFEFMRRAYVALREMDRQKDQENER